MEALRVASSHFIQRPELTRRQIVTRLYRQGLKALFSWSVNRDLFIEEAEKLRAQFKAAKHLPPGSPEARRALREGLQKLSDAVHPDPYSVNYMPGGCAYMRNAPQPLHIVFPNGVPEDVEHSVVPVHPDMIPLTFRPDTSPLLVDPSSAKAIVQVPLIELYRDWEAREARGELAE